MARTCTLWLALIVALALAPAASAHRGGDGGYDVELLCEGAPCPESRHRDGTRWVLGEYGVRYAVRVTNRSGRWVEAVVTVDGRDVVNGSSGAWSNRGYLLAPWESIDVDGFRTSDREVAAFRFTSVPDSYAGRVGAGQHAGVVGVAFFPGTRPWVEPPPVYRPDPEPWPDPWYEGSAEDEAAPAPKSAGKARADRGLRPPRDRQHLGTRFGERRWSPVSEVDFTRSNPDHPARTLQIRYDDRDGLRARGVALPWTPPRYTDAPPPRRYTPPPPDPFPAR